jgi:peptidyl-prolyl cis-trans isomerase SurA
MLLLGILVAIPFTAGCRRSTSTPATTASPSPNAWAVVDGREITRDDVEKAYSRAVDASQPLSTEEALSAKLNLLNELIVQEILLARAQRLKVEVPASDVDAAYAQAKQNISDEAFQQELAKRKLTTEDMREGLRRQLLVEKVIEQEVDSKVAVSDQEVTDFFNVNKEQFNLAEDGYYLAQIVITPVREPQVANRTGDDAATPQAANTKLQMLLERIKGGASFRDLAMDYSEDPETAPRGGDLGLVSISRLKQVPPQLRDVVLKATPNTANVASMGGAHTIVFVGALEKAGQRDLSTPGVRERITESLRGRKGQLLRTAYITAAQSDANVTNYLARRVVETQGKIE